MYVNNSKHNSMGFCQGEGGRVDLGNKKFADSYRFSLGLG